MKNEIMLLESLLRKQIEKAFGKNSTLRPNWTVAIAFYFLVGLGLGALVIWFVGDYIPIPNVYIFSVAFIVWSWIYFFKLFDKFWVNPDAYTAHIYRNMFTRSHVVATLDKVSGPKVEKGIFVLYPGWAPIWPIHEMVREPVSLKTTVSCAGVVDVQDSNGIPFKIPVEARLNVIADENLPIILATDPKVIEKFFKLKVEAATQSIFRKKVGVEVMANSESFADEVSKSLFAGENISPDERSYAHTVERLVIGVIDMDVEAQAVLQSAQYAKWLSKGIEELRAVCPDQTTLQFALSLLSKNSKGVDFTNVRVN